MRLKSCKKLHGVTEYLQWDLIMSKCAVMVHNLVERNYENELMVTPKPDKVHSAVKSMPPLPKKLKVLHNKV